MRIGIDAMGGDHAPDAVLEGALAAVTRFGDDDRLVLIGDEAIIRDHIEEAGLVDDPRIEIEPTTAVVEMAEPPVAAVRNKPDSSLVRMAWLGSKKAGEKRCDAVISAGNTGACAAAAQMHMRRLKGVHRPGIAVTIPAFGGPTVLCDVGANPDPKPSHLHQYARMAAVYAREVVGIEGDPRVAILSIGGEEGKGNQLTRETHKLIKADAGLNYVGYIEGRGVFAGEADVVVCEGFTGNVVLKLSEGLASTIFEAVARELLEIDPEMAMRFEPVVKEIYRKHDYHEHGGAPLLGANGTCFICHGSSVARTITNAVKMAVTHHEHHVNDVIERSLAEQADALAAEGAA